MTTVINGLISLVMWIPFGIAGLVLGWFQPHVQAKMTEPGIVYSVKQAESFGMNAVQTYRTIVSELQPKHVRLIAYWDRIEKQRGVYDFSEFDQLVAESERSRARLTLIVGQKVPRWPECHIPGWASALPQADERAALLSYLQAFVDRYKKSPAVEFWQVENEPFFNFGVCPKADVPFFDEELRVVRSLDGRPIIVTMSGEMDVWNQAFSRADIVGISLYRRTVATFAGLHITFDYPLPPLFYYVKAQAFSSVFHKPVMITELQLEPWLTVPIQDAPLEKQFDMMPFDAFASNASYAAATRIPHVYMWGVEWWQWLRLHNHPEFFDYVRKNFFSL